MLAAPLPEPSAESLAAAAEGAMSVRQACAFTGDCRSRLFDLMDAGVLEWFHVGPHRRITRASLVRYLAAMIDAERAKKAR